MVDLPACQEDGSTAGLYYCQQLQPAVQQDSDGQPRFNSSRVQTWYAFVGFITDADYPDFSTLKAQSVEVAWTGASTLIATASTLVAASLLSF